MDKFDFVEKDFSFMQVVRTVKQIMSICFEFNTTAAFRVETVLKTMFELMIS